MITKYFHAPWNYQMNLLVSLQFLFCFVFIGDESVTLCFNQKNTGKAFIYMKKINCLVTTLYEVFNRLQAFLFFFLFFENQRGNQRNTFFTLWQPIRAQVFLLARESHHNVQIAEKLGKRVNKSEKLNTRITMTTIS